MARHLLIQLDQLKARLTPRTFHVNTTLDTVAANFKTGKDSTGHVSLRSAIMAADANPNSSDTIILPAGTFNLTIAPTGDDGPSSGDLDILVTKKLTIKGSTHGGQTIINGNNLDRVFFTKSGNVAISNVVIEHGQAVELGGGLLNEGANDNLNSVQFVDNIVIGEEGPLVRLVLLVSREAPAALGPMRRVGRFATWPGHSHSRIARLTGTKRSAGPVQ